MSWYMEFDADGRFVQVWQTGDRLGELESPDGQLPDWLDGYLRYFEIRNLGMDYAARQRKQRKADASP